MKETTIVFVRIDQKAQQETFFRCGISFAKQWQRLEGVDQATYQRLEQEQVLETSLTEPADFAQPGTAVEEDANLSSAETIGQLAVQELRDKIDALEQANQGLTEANTGLTQQIAHLEQQNTDLAAEKVGFENQLQALSTANAELTKQLEAAPAKTTTAAKAASKKAAG